MHCKAQTFAIFQALVPAPDNACLGRLEEGIEKGRGGKIDQGEKGRGRWAMGPASPGTGVEPETGTWAGS